MLRRPDVYFVPRYVAADLYTLRAAFREDPAYGIAVATTAHELARALRNPASYGTALKYDLAPWRRSKYSSSPGSNADLRLIFRPRQGAGIDLLMFGERYAADGTSIYVGGVTRTR